jgi:hypothetical protein
MNFKPLTNVKDSSFLLEAFFLEDVENHGSKDDEEVDSFIDTPSTLSSNSKKMYQQIAWKRQLF